MTHQPRGRVTHAGRDDIKDASRRIMGQTLTKAWRDRTQHGQRTKQPLTRNVEHHLIDVPCWSRKLTM